MGCLVAPAFPLSPPLSLSCFRAESIGASSVAPCLVGNCHNSLVLCLFVFETGQSNLNFIINSNPKKNKSKFLWYNNVEANNAF
jgi:hypothetical protein